jgi:hypothetical protein
MFISKEEMEAVIRMAFEKGEEWGTTYSGWFTPSDDQREIRLLQSMNDCLKMVNEMKGLE